jgi:hypothetical protein
MVQKSVAPQRVALAARMQQSEMAVMYCLIFMCVLCVFVY